MNISEKLSLDVYKCQVAMRRLIWSIDSEQMRMDNQRELFERTTWDDLSQMRKEVFDALCSLEDRLPSNQEADGYVPEDKDYDYSPSEQQQLF